MGFTIPDRTMNMIGRLVIATCGLVVSSGLAFAQDRDAMANTAAQNVLVSSLNSDQPRITLKAWLTDLIGPDRAIAWGGANDCGEQTGNPALDAGRNFPLCTDVRIALPEGRVLVINLMVGTFRDGVTGTPGIRDIALEATDHTYHAATIWSVAPLLRALLRRDGIFDIGRTRSDVETRLGHAGLDGGIVAIGTTRYVLGGDILVEVPYDDVGGPGSSSNRINGPVRVFEGHQSLD